MRTNQTIDLIRLWVCRIMIRAGGIKRFLWAGSIRNNAVADLLGLGDWVLTPLKDPEEAAIRASIESLLKTLERKKASVVLPRRMRENLAQFAKFTRLPAAQEAVIAFLALFEDEPVLRDAFRVMGHIDRGEFARLVAVAIGIPPRMAATALAPNGPLMRSGFLKWQTTSHTGSSVRFTRPGVAHHLLHEAFAAEGVLRKVARSPVPAKLGLRDFPQIADTLRDLTAYLRAGIGRKMPGCNVFVYGDPGTGKTELARTLGRALRCPVYEVSDEDDDGNPLDASGRIESLRVANTLLRGRRAMLVFDEAEDLFRPAGMVDPSAADRSKSWINRILEQNAVPTIWLSNRVDCLDPAFVRRFDFVFELTAPPVEQKRKMIAKVCPRIDSSLAWGIARCEELTPAVIARAHSVATKARPGKSRSAVQETFARLLANTLKAQGHDPCLIENASRDDDDFSVDFLNPDPPLDRLYEILGAAGPCKICLYGPPGTGKSSFGRWLADACGIALHARTASDVLSPFHGETERRLAKMFEEARERSAILMIDEIDSLLADRRHAVRTWEVSQVNEMLAQLDGFKGTLIASTNRIESMDEAAKRRFDFKIKFDFLTGDQVCALLRFHCESMGIAGPSPDVLAAASRIENATPGDFKIAEKQHRFRPSANPAEFLDVVIRECAGKSSGPSRRIGFAS